MNANTRHDPSFRAPDYVRGIAPYVPGKPVEELAREFGLDPATIVKLASNENPRGASAPVRAAIDAAVGELSRYPDGNGFLLKSALAARHGVPADGVVLGNGSNDILELVTQAFLRPGDAAVYSRTRSPSIRWRRWRAAPPASRCRRASWATTWRRCVPRSPPATRVVFVANPNNPTGTWIEPAALEAFVASVPEDVVVVLDEAYNEYLEPGQVAPSAAWVGRYPNLIVSRTFSKAYGLAALRIGYGLMHPAVAGMLNRVRQPFNVNALAQAAALAALADTAYVDESRALNREGRRVLEDGVRALGRSFVPSHANFLLVEVGDGAAVYASLLRQGVIVRPVANYGLPGHLRVTVGLPAENRRFLDALAVALA